MVLVSRPQGHGIPTLTRRALHREEALAETAKQVIGSTQEDEHQGSGAGTNTSLKVSPGGIAERCSVFPMAKRRLQTTLAQGALASLSPSPRMPRPYSAGS